MCFFVYHWFSRETNTRISAHNMNPAPQEIDVHRLSVAEAINQVKRALRDSIVSNSPQLKIITGKGKHSKDGVPVLKLAIVRELQK